METFEPTVMFQPAAPDTGYDGLVARHDMPCPVFGAAEPATYNLTTGTFHPSVKATEQGYHLIKARTGFQKFLFKKFFKNGMV